MVQKNSLELQEHRRSSKIGLKPWKTRLYFKQIHQNWRVALGGYQADSAFYSPVMIVTFPISIKASRIAELKASRIDELPKYCSIFFFVFSNSCLYDCRQWKFRNKISDLDSISIFLKQWMLHINKKNVHLPERKKSINLENKSNSICAQGQKYAT